MKKFISVIVAVNCAISTFSQTETNIYLGKHNEVVSNKKDAESVYNLTVKDGKQKIIFKSNSGKNKHELKIIDDSTAKVYTDGDYDFTIIYHKIDSGFIDKRLFKNGYESGYSKYIFPFIKEGTWTRYDDSIKANEEYYVNNKEVGNKYWNDDGTLYMDDLYMITDEPVKYNNGDLNQVRYAIQEVTQYPEEASKKNIKGTVIVQFVVTSDGKVAGVKVLRGVHPLLDEAAIKAVNSIPEKWTPGIWDGKNVNCQLVIPIIFQMN